VDPSRLQGLVLVGLVLGGFVIGALVLGRFETGGFGIVRRGIVAGARSPGRVMTRMSAHGCYAFPR
jgi:hypothetical protein